jgi:AraC family transcriptional regulator of adaptative response/methylated-DNA-[protein]-cysteine methyltransferase
MSESGQTTGREIRTLPAYFNSLVPEPIMAVMAEAPTRSATHRPSSTAAVRYTIAKSALGFVAIARTEKGLAAAFISDDAEWLATHMVERFPNSVRAPGDEWTDRVIEALDTTTDDPDLPVDPKGTEFQKAVWKELRRIPAGSTITYSELAKRIGKPDSVRAVAAACGANPIAVIVPCHRVIGKDGSLTGYAWGIEKKQMLLERERRR